MLPTRHAAIGAAAFFLAPRAACAAPPVIVSHDIRDYVQPGLQDLTLTLKTGRYDSRAGDKIGKEFGQTYKMSNNGGLRYKQPSFLRVDGRMHGPGATLVMDGFSRRVSVGWFHRSKNTAQTPGEVTGLLSVGLLNAFYPTRRRSSSRCRRLTERSARSSASVIRLPCATLRSACSGLTRAPASSAAARSTIRAARCLPSTPTAGAGVGGLAVVGSGCGERPGRVCRPDVYAEHQTNTGLTEAVFH